MINQQISHYRILEKIGEGAMGQVYLAEDMQLDRRVALKVLANPNPEADQVMRFEREAKAVAALNHPNILAIHDFGRDAGRPYVVMELLTGHTLRQLLDEGPIPLRKAVTYGLEVVQGLAAAHHRGIYHRDLKPANVFVTDEGLVKIVDFGLAAVRTSPLFGLTPSDVTVARDQPTAPGTILGTIGYMAPEQVRGESADHRSDLFAFGGLMFELLTRQRAFSEPSAVETMHAILRKDPPFVLLEHAGVPSSLIGILRRCLEKRPEDRFQSAQDLGFSLRSVMGALSAGSSTPTIVREAQAALAASLADHHSIAVLPFTNMAGDADTEYFSDGVTEDIINALAQLPELRVAARTSSFAFKAKSVDIAEVGSKLKVDTVLEGSVRRAGKRLRVTAQLINVKDGYQLWSERYDRELDDVFAIQDDIATNIARRLRLTLARNVDEPLVKPSTEHMEAYDLYLKGRHYVEQRGEGIARGLEFLNKAITVDPEFAPAYAAMAETLTLLAVYSMGNPAQRLQQAKVAAVKAVSLDAGLAEAHNAMALVSVLWDWDWAATEQAFNRALEINPNYVSARYWKGLLYFLWVRGRREEALAEALHAIELDPIATIPVYALGLILISLGQYSEAIARARHGLERDPTSFLLYRVIGAAYLGDSQHEPAIAALEKASELSLRQPGIRAELAAAYALAGRTAEAEQLRTELIGLSKTMFVSSVSLAVATLALGNVDEAYDYLERSLQQKDPLFLAASTWPTLRSLRKEPRVRALFQRVGLDWVS